MTGWTRLPIRFRLTVAFVAGLALVRGAECLRLRPDGIRPAGSDGCGPSLSRGAPGLGRAAARAVDGHGRAHPRGTRRGVCPDRRLVGAHRPIEFDRLAHPIASSAAHPVLWWGDAVQPTRTGHRQRGSVARRAGDDISGSVCRGGRRVPAGSSRRAAAARRDPRDCGNDRSWPHFPRGVVPGGRRGASGGADAPAGRRDLRFRSRPPIVRVSRRRTRSACSA